MAVIELSAKLEGSAEASAEGRLQMQLAAVLFGRSSNGPAEEPSEEKVPED